MRILLLFVEGIIKFFILLPIYIIAITLYLISTIFIYIIWNFGEKDEGKRKGFNEFIGEAFNID